jgi:CheY-like chemotaxis protein
VDSPDFNQGSFYSNSLPDKSGLNVLREYFEFTGDKRSRRTLDADVKCLPLRPKDRIYSRSFQRIYGRKLGIAGRQLGDLIVIGSTGETDPHELSTGLEIGMDAIIIKPFCVVQLEHLIHIIYSLDSEQQT